MYAKIMSLNYSSCNAIFYGHPLQDTKADHWTLKKVLFSLFFLLKPFYFIYFLHFYPKLVDPCCHYLDKIYKMFPVFQHLIDISIKVIPSGFHILFYKVDIFTLIKSFLNRDSLLPFFTIYWQGKSIYFLFLRLKSLSFLYACVMIFKRLLKPVSVFHTKNLFLHYLQKLVCN